MADKNSLNRKLSIIHSFEMSATVKFPEVISTNKKLVFDVLLKYISVHFYKTSYVFLTNELIDGLINISFADIWTAIY